MEQAGVVMNSKRIAYLDILKIVAIFAVVMIHIAGAQFGNYSTDSFEWAGINFIDSSSRWAVPIFAMVSGALFLDPNRKVSIYKLYTKNIFRLITAFLFWSVVFALYKAVKSDFSLGIMEFVKTVLLGEYHMWFMYMLAGLYILVPLLRPIAANKKLLTYAVGVCFFLMLVSGYASIVPGGTTLSLIVSSTSLNLGYIGYFLLGRLLMGASFSRSVRLLIYAFGVIGFAITMWGTYVLSVNKASGVLVETLYEFCTINVAVMALAVFVLVKQMCTLWGSVSGEETRIWKIAFRVADLSLGAYLLHVFFVWEIVKYPLCCQFPSAYILGALILVVSFAVAYILRKIPFIGKLIT